MKYANYVARCPFELGDVVKLILDKSKNILSESEYTVDDILTIYSVKTGIVTFKISLSDECGEPLALREIDNIHLIRYSK